MTAYTRCPGCDAARTVTATARDDGTESLDAEDPQPCPQCDGTGCVPFQGYVLVAAEEDR
ncbi:hypothetical protein LX16_2474 [Stackebrandtia albiflava]|uniref:Uncharacterized protein n=1 Tax=Stackebrandtia albiflava TaxID=406432 RepID=A0A562V1P6_9ACTN|nr:hypothetical protein [Stackebrandtia albiflava]TWJ11743.1 hypothetical protein LX16_2474 [Stackebrandtia albiflava]